MVVTRRCFNIFVMRKGNKLVNLNVKCDNNVGSICECEMYIFVCECECETCECVRLVNLIVNATLV